MSQNRANYGHEPVLCEQVSAFLLGRGGCRFVDATVGMGGHAAALLAARNDIELLCLDRDEEMLKKAKDHLIDYGSRVHFAQAPFSKLAEECDGLGWETVDGVLMDLGVCSVHLDDARRGFSFRYDGPLDMRLDRRQRITAASILNSDSEDELTRIFGEYGDIKHARSLARAVVTDRAKGPFSKTGQFASLVDRVVGRHHRRRVPAPTQAFQALRIAVNDEVPELEAGLQNVIDKLGNHGRLVVIAFHSLEDRIVKRFFRYEAAVCVCPPGLPECRCGKEQRLQVLTKKPVTPSGQEKAANPRAGSAKMRAAERVRH